jgi:hypothetical protein
MVYGTVYDVPQEIGPVDVAVFGSILLHLRDPFLALQSALRMTTETVVVAEGIYRSHIMPILLGPFKPIAVLLPDARKVSPRDSWWALPPNTVVQFLRVLGFQSTHITYHSQRYKGKRAYLYTVVGRRTSQIKR